MCGLWALTSSWRPFALKPYDPRPRSISQLLSNKWDLGISQLMQPVGAYPRPEMSLLLCNTLEASAKTGEQQLLGP